MSGSLVSTLQSDTSRGAGAPGRPLDVRLVSQHPVRQPEGEPAVTLDTGPDDSTTSQRPQCQGHASQQPSRSWQLRGHNADNERQRRSA
jgi:hypothetical protein